MARWTGSAPLVVVYFWLKPPPVVPRCFRGFPRELWLSMKAPPPPVENGLQLARPGPQPNADFRGQQGNLGIFDH